MDPSKELQPDRTRSDGALLDSALLNLNIAQQYIDESRHLVEHRLICFHYAIAILARYRDPYVKEMIHLARQHFLDAANWNLDDESKELLNAQERIICEAQYNLGVIDELEERYDSSHEYYDSAASTAERKGDDYSGIEILAKFGRISVQIKNRQRAELFRNGDLAHRIINEIESLLLRIERETQTQMGKAPMARARAFSATPFRPVGQANFGRWVSRLLTSLKGKPAEPTESTPRRTDELIPPLRGNSTLTLIQKKLNSLKKELSGSLPDPEDLDPPSRYS